MSYFKVSIVYLLLGWLRLVNGNTSEYANGECVGGILGPGGKQILLEKIHLDKYLLQS